VYVLKNRHGYLVLKSPGTGIWHPNIAKAVRFDSREDAEVEATLRSEYQTTIEEGAE
jgi:hypothetical protein